QGPDEEEQGDGRRRRGAAPGQGQAQRQIGRPDPRAGGEEHHRRHRRLAAPGARARELPPLKADGKRVWTYRHAMTPPEMPTKLLVIGSGAIGIEFASFYKHMGAGGTVVEMLARAL